jgi:plastocyanin
MRWHGVVALSLLVLLAGATVPASGGLGLEVLSPRASPAASGSIVVAATGDYGYQPDSFDQVPVDANISVTFSDDSPLQHSFTISSREGFVIPTGDTPTQLAQFLASYPPFLSLLVNGSGDVATGNFTSPATPGWYEFVCNVSGHFQSGMYGFIAFGESLPPNLTRVARVGLGLGNLGPWDAAAIAAIFGAFVLALVLWHRRRSTPRAPPGPPRVPGTPPAR